MQVGSVDCDVSGALCLMVVIMVVMRMVERCMVMSLMTFVVVRMVKLFSYLLVAV